MIFIKDKRATKNSEVAHLWPTGCSLPTPDIDCALRVCILPLMTSCYTCTTCTTCIQSASNSTSEDRHKAASDLINHLVTLVTTMLDLSSEAMKALLCIHQPKVIEIWNKDESKDATIKTFWDIK